MGTEILLDIIIVSIVALFIFFGIKKGFARSFIEIVGYILAILISFSVANTVSEYVYEKKIKETIVSSVSDITDKEIKGDSKSNEAIWEAIPSYLKTLTGLEKDTVDEYLNKYKKDTSDSVKGTAIAVSENVVKPIATSAVRLVVEIVLLILLLILVKFFAKIIGKLFNKSILRGVNKFFGGILGAAKGTLIALISVSIFMLLMPLFNNELFSVTPKVIESTFIFKYLVNIFNAL